MIYILALSFVAAVFMYEPHHHLNGYDLRNSMGVMPERMPTPSPSLESFSVRINNFLGKC